MKKFQKVLGFILITAMLLDCGALSALAEDLTYADTISWNAEYDVVVVGFGAAGGATAITAADLGAKVLLIEKAPEGHEGGNSRYSAQAVLTIRDTEKAEKYYNILRGKYDQSDAVMKAFIEKAAESDTWINAMGGNAVVFQYPGAAPEYPELEGSDAMYLSAIDGELLTGKFWQLVRKNVMDRSENIDVWFDAPGKELIQDPISKTVIGVKIEKNGEMVNVRAKNGVVLCTGGFEANQQMVANYLNLPELYPIGSVYNTGDGILMAQAVGADLWHMGNYMGGYANIVNPETGRAYLSSSLSGRAYIFVGSDGTRFMNETVSLRHGYTNFHGRWINNQVPTGAYAIFDEASFSAGKLISTFSEGNLEEIEKGWIVKANTVAELSEKIGINADSLTAEIEKYNSYCVDGIDPVFGRSAATLLPLEEGPYYAIPVKNSVINTQGGPRRNENAEVLDTNGNPIPNLYSAGELGAIHPNVYQGAGNLAECIAFGRIAGENASKEKDTLPTLTFTKANNDIRTFETAETTYELKENERIGKGTGIGGELVVKVTLDGEKIMFIDILSHSETAGISDGAIDKVPQRIIAAQSTDVDGVTGATLTSNAIKEAVKNALAQ